jgi:uncharacterized protein
MRLSPNEPADDPERRCIVTGDRGPKSGLVRLALGPDGVVAPDVRSRAAGRGAWIGVDRAGLAEALAKGKLKGALSRAFKTPTIIVPDDLPARTEAALERAALDRLGLESRAGGLVTGSDRIEDAARKGQLHILLHASDAGVDGNRRLDQAWRVGSDTQGSAQAGLVLGVDRTILSKALGRENVVHIGVTDRAAAARVSSMLDRWHYFIGRGTGAVPCETASQGSQARGADQD